MLPAIVDLLLLATTSAPVHMGGSSDVELLVAGMGHGYLVSAMVICVVAEIRAFVALLRAPPCWVPLQSAGVHGQHHVVYRLRH